METPQSANNYKDQVLFENELNENSTQFAHLGYPLSEFEKTMGFQLFFRKFGEFLNFLKFLCIFQDFYVFFY